MADRPTIDVATPAGGWGAPWPNVAEIEAVLPHDKWTLVGGLMAQLHGIHAGFDAVRPTNDVDIVVHVETTRRVASETASASSSPAQIAPGSRRWFGRFRTLPLNGERLQTMSASMAKPRFGF